MIIMLICNYLSGRQQIELKYTAPWMPGTQLYTPGIHRADTRRILEPILFCQAIEIKDPTSLFFEDADKFL